MTPDELYALAAAIAGSYAAIMLAITHRLTRLQVTPPPPAPPAPPIEVARLIVTLPSAARDAAIRGW